MKRTRELLLSLAVVVALASVGNAAVLFYDDCDDTSAWSGTGLSYIDASTGKFVMNSANADPNLAIETASLGITAGDLTLTFDNAKQSTGWNHTTAYLQVGLGDGLAVRFTRNPSSTASLLLYNGTAYSLDVYPDGFSGNIAMKLDYTEATKRVVVTMVTGKYKDPADGLLHNANNTVIYDNTFAASLDVVTYDKLAIKSNARYNGGLTGSTIDNIQLVPEPATMGLLGVGGLLALLRRRQRS